MKDSNSTGISNTAGISNPSSVKFDRSKTHANTGTIGHIDAGQSSLWEAFAFVLGNCSTCYGTGKVKAMQRAMISQTESIRTEDVQVNCSMCNGTGIIKKGE